MFKLVNIINKAKGDRMTNHAKIFTVYRFKKENKLRWDTIDLFIENGIILVPLVQYKKRANGWELVRISEEARTKLFNEALSDGWKLFNDHFKPELDNLDDNTIGSILFKVLHEIDLLDEEELEDIPIRSARSWRKRAVSFIKKYREFIEHDKHPGEHMLYKNI